MLGSLGIDPVTAAMAAAAAAKLVGGLFGRSKEFLERQKRYDTIDGITDHYWALMPSLPDYVRPIVRADVLELMQRNVDSRTVQDLDSALNWFSAREQAWNLIQPPSVVVPPGVSPKGRLVPGDVSAFETAGFPWWIGALIVGGLLIGPGLLKGK